MKKEVNEKNLKEELINAYIYRLKKSRKTQSTTLYTMYEAKASEIELLYERFFEGDILTEAKKVDATF